MAGGCDGSCGRGYADGVMRTGLCGRGYADGGGQILRCAQNDKGVMTKLLWLNCCGGFVKIKINGKTV